MKLKESLSRISDTYVQSATRALMSLQKEDQGWSPFGDFGEEQIPFGVIKVHAKRAKRLAALNPLVKRGITVRSAYMFTDGIEFTGGTKRSQDNNEAQARSVEARVRDEMSFNTSGLVVYKTSRLLKEVSPVPIGRINAFARDSNGRGENDIYAIQIAPMDGDANAKAEWYIVDGKDWREVKTEDGRADEIKTNVEYRVVYECVNRGDDEITGKPDLMGALYYAQAYKEYLESAYIMSKALGRIAYKITSVNARQQRAVESKISRPGGIGDTATLGAGQDMQAMSKAGAGIDFGAASPLASMISAALDVPLSVLLTDGSAGGRQGAETALEDPTFKALDLRREVHQRLIKKLGKALGEDWKLECGAINNDQIHRRIQSIILAKDAGLLWEEEARSGVQQVLRTQVQKAATDLPPKLEPETESDEDSDSGVGPLSDGTNDNRENPTDA